MRTLANDLQQAVPGDLGALPCNWVGHSSIGFKTAVQLGWTLNKEGDDEKTLIILMMIQIS